MALSTFSGRLKKRSDGTKFSSLPISLPNGLITVHSPYSVSNDDRNEVTGVNAQTGVVHKQSLNSFNLVEIHYTCFGCIVDHCWTSITTESSDDGEINHTILAVLSRPIQHTMNQSSGSLVKIFKSSTSGHELLSTIRLNSYNSCITMNANILVVGGSSGVIVYNLKEILRNSIFDNEDNDVSLSLDEFNLIPSNPILAIHLNSSYLITASMDSIRVWNVNDVMKYIQNEVSDMKETAVPTIWMYKLNLERITCIDMTDDYEFLSICCWDGKAFVFRTSDDTSWTLYKSGSRWEDHCQVRIIFETKLYSYLYSLVQSMHRHSSRIIKMPT